MISKKRKQVVLTLDDKPIVLDCLKSETQEKLYAFDEERGLTKSICFNNGKFDYELKRAKVALGRQ